MESIYLEKPWISSYPQGVPSEIEIPVKSVGETFDEAVDKWSDNTAIIFYGKKIKYVELKEFVDRFATALSALGVQKGDRVAVLLLNNPNHIISFYALLKLGAIITSISPVYVSSEMKHQIIDSGAETIICQDFLYNIIEETEIKFKNVILAKISDFLPNLKKIVGKSLLKGVYQKLAIPSTTIYKSKGFYHFMDLIKEHPPNPPQVNIDSMKDIAMLPYTSGTTGKPKGVILSHFNLISDDLLYHKFYSIFEDGKETMVAYMPFYHASGQLFSMLGGIIHGNTLIVITNPDLDVIINSIIRYGVSLFLGAPTMYELLNDYKKTNRVNWKNMKIVESGADALNEITAKTWKDKTEVVIHEMYGQTETVCVTHGNPFGKQKLASIGVPLPNTMAAILDPDKDDFVPLGETGELAINGPMVTTMGYWNNQESAKECESIIDGLRWWRTGDLASMDEDGYFFIYDRKRDLIKYKGLRVFAREVEEILKMHPKIKEVGVIGVPNIKVGEDVKAMVVLESDARGTFSEADIVEFCDGKLAHYKIPKIIEFLGEIPKTDVGKVSRRELREWEF
ncbi:AMP-binding protein [Thermodesulfobacteriota bacterium]